MSAEFGLLGEVVVAVHGQAVDPGPAKQRCVLAALAMDVNQLVTADQLIERVWGTQCPPRARATLSSYVSRLRGVLAATDAAELVRRPAGYVLNADESLIDVHRFRLLTTRARSMDDENAAAALTEAIGLWRGEPLAGLDGDWASFERDRLRQQLLAAECDLTDVMLRLGHSGSLVSELATRTTRHRLNERIAAQYLLALYRDGRVADALGHYQLVRARLIEELGTEPSAALQSLHRQILDLDPALTASRPAAGEIAVIPRQLPAPPAPFVGREADMARLDEVFDTGRAVVISTLAGTGGIGKTWLALHWAHRRLDRFPDGQLFVDLRGFGPDDTRMDPAVALRGFLGALGVSRSAVPADAHAQEAMFRSLVAGKRMLIVIDNVADAAQVTPLLPGSSSCTVVITSRTALTSLVSRHGARHLSLDVLGDAESLALLTERLGPARIDADRDAALELVRFCTGFPLALAIIAGRALVADTVPLGKFVAELQATGLAALDDTDPAGSLGAVLSWSLRALDPVDRTVFGLLGLAPGPDIALPAAANLTGLSPAATEHALRRLEDASLVRRDDHDRFWMHDLVRRYAVTRAQAELTEDDRERALRRVLDFYLRTAHAGDLVLFPHRAPSPLGPAEPGSHPQLLADGAAAAAWFEAEHECLLDAQRLALARGQHRAAWQFAWTMSIFHQLRGLHHDHLETWLHALDTIEHLADPVSAIRTHRNIANACAALERYDQAVTHLHEAVTLAEKEEAHAELGHTYLVLCRVDEVRRDFRQGRDHGEQALHFFRLAGNPAWEATALNSTGWCAALLGDYDHAREYCRTAVELSRLHQSPTVEANALNSLGYVDHHTGQHRSAIENYRLALRAYGDFGSTHGRADTLEGIGHPYAALGQYAEARAAWTEAAALHESQQRTEDAARVRRHLQTLPRRPAS
ncbi:AfsR/SARP family transcriptional regulator [Kutzneria kofuensis]|uniref:DNA-binding SARP family transcriptional activator/tetratricopeptide (TPR) repeat protein n=1 Tax=Kutzneria kofuensis TaxID=103725 RepID=A0A7W9NLY3_9PSEU|nr:BTAD domain-containing putative transcriptional regulator [Kutzneria kofuensis]MBB5896961.1 DNA-binding SARP family transcriptional activator/tetratricopeptide (TPR) repeat protein [Kutzneria kofuensis]